MSRPDPGPALSRLAVAFALGGGLILCILAGLVVVSVLGRLLFVHPIPGDFEIVGIGTAIAVFLCLPYGQVRRGHVTVDLVLARTPAALREALDRAADLLYALLSFAFAVRMISGCADLLRQGDVSMIIAIPLWYALPFGIAALLLLGCCCLYTAVRGPHAFGASP
ncbi:MAG: TRAP transporter small permease [Gammaproteobacteria bacterium]|nr:TRAP transporter small permease [Gammaproteobacteria bacterium]